MQEAPINIEEKQKQPGVDSSIQDITSMSDRGNSQRPPVVRRQSQIVGPEMFRKQKEGSLLEKYEQLDIIGKGCFGEIRKVKDKATGKIRVLKSIFKAKCQKTELLVDEIEILKKLVCILNKSVGSSQHLSFLRILRGYKSVLFNN